MKICFSLLFIFGICHLCYCQNSIKTINIPVVFHVLYADSLTDNGINADSRNNGNNTMFLPRQKIEAELADLDRDFQNKNLDITDVISEYKNVIGNPGIHFYLSEIIYEKVDRKSIIAPRTNTDLLHKLSPPKDNRSFLNVYISDVKFRGKLTNGLTPVKTDSTANIHDDVNLNYQWVGLGYRLLTHEVGDWLGLWHTWDNSQKRDGIDDIPLQTTYTDMDCVSCPPQVPDPITNHSKFSHSNYNNFMDYSGCRKMFSIKQAEKMRNTINSFRKVLWNNSEGLK